MRSLCAKLIACAASLFAATFVFAQQAQPPQEWSTAFRVFDRYITSGTKGALDASGRQVTKRQVFTLVDLNGGSLNNGDKIKIKWEASLWREEDGKVIRVAARGAPERECTFTVKVRGKGIMLETASGKLVSVPADGGALTTKEKPDETTIFEAIPNPALSDAAPSQPKQAAQQSQTVALRTAGDPARYITMVANGGLDASGKKITPKQVFTMIDLNGGSLNDGDKVKIGWESSLWHEDKASGKVHRVPARSASEAECTFKVKVQPKGIMLETASKKLVSAPATGGPLVTSDKPDETTLFEAIPNPTLQP